MIVIAPSHLSSTIPMDVLTLFEIDGKGAGEIRKNIIVVISS